jgi:hypothetical protein
LGTSFSAAADQVGLSATSPPASGLFATIPRAKKRIATEAPRHSKKIGLESESLQ